MQVLGGVVGPQGLHSDVRFVDAEPVSDARWDVLEDLSLGEGVGEYEFVVEWVEKADLHEGCVGGASGAPPGGVMTCGRLDGMPVAVNWLLSEAEEAIEDSTMILDGTACVV